LKDVPAPLEAPMKPEKKPAGPGRAVDVSVIVPVSAGDGALDAVVKGFGDELARLGRSCEFVIVDDGVGDPLDAMLRAAATQGYPVKVVRFNQRFGESVALTAGFEKADGAVVFTSPPYLQVEPAELSKMLDALEQGFDCVAAWRHPRVDAILNRIQSKIFNGVTRIITKSRLHDLNCNLRAMKRRVLEDVSIYGDLFRFLPVMAERQGFKVTEVKVRHREEQGKTGFFGFGVYVRRFFDILTMFFLLRFMKRPLRFFGLCGLAFLAVGLSINVYLAILKIVERAQIADRPILILGVLLMVLGFQTISIGLIGEIIIFTHARGVKEYKVEEFIE
jgi:glycosyltransferase involved in cell wall biosynthesis